MFDITMFIKITLLSRALFCIADLSIAELILQKPATAYELAQEKNINADSLERVMRLLISYNFFTQNEDGTYAHTKESLHMCAHHPQSIRPFLLHDDISRWHAIGNLQESIQTGRNGFESLYGSPYFDYIADKPVLSQRFDEAMNSISEEEESIIASVGEYKGVVADIGGGSGGLIQKIIAHHTDVSKGIILDICCTVKNSAANNEKIEYIDGSFFEPCTINADIFILKRILHDWDDTFAEMILTNIAKTMNRESKIYIIDAILDQCIDQQMIAAVDLLLLTIFGGKERTFAQWEDICLKAHLIIKKIHNINGNIHLIECCKE